MRHELSLAEHVVVSFEMMVSPTMNGHLTFMFFSN